MATKLQSRINQSILNEMQFYKLIHALQWIYYRIPKLIEAIASFDFQPWDCAATESRGLSFQFAETDAARWSGSAVGSIFWLDCAVSDGFLKLSWKWKLLQQCNFLMIFDLTPANRNSATNIEDEFNKILLQDPWNWWIQAKECCENFERNERIWENFSLIFC